MARRGRPKRPLVVSDQDRRVLEQIARQRTSAQVMAQRARIILRCDQGGTDAEVARELDVWPQTVGRWRNRYIDGGLEALSDKNRPGQPRKISDAHVEEVIRTTLEQPPPDGGTHWSTRSMAERSGLNQTAISRIWRAFGLKPHLVDEWKLSNDPFFIEKVRDVTGLYLNPPDAALVLCVDEKSQIQALNRSAPVLPISIPGTGTPGRSCGPRPPRTSSRPSPHIFIELTTQNTRSCSFSGTPVRAGDPWRPQELGR